MSDFTPGPWKVFTVQDGPNKGQLLGVGQQTGEGVTDAYGGLWGYGPEQMANARLIAAAPDLLSVAQRVAVREVDGAWYVTVFGDDGGFWSARLPDEMIRPAREFDAALRAAISRATGSSSQSGGE